MANERDKQSNTKSNTLQQKKTVQWVATLGDSLMMQIKIFHSTSKANEWIKNKEDDKAIRSIDFNITSENNVIYKSIMIVYDIGPFTDADELRQ